MTYDVERAKARLAEDEAEPPILRAVAASAQNYADECERHLLQAELHIRSVRQCLVDDGHLVAQ